jgi:hypothetical protein
MIKCLMKRLIQAQLMNWQLSHLGKGSCIAPCRYHLGKGSCIAPCQYHLGKGSCIAQCQHHNSCWQSHVLSCGYASRFQNHAHTALMLLFSSNTSPA